MNENLPNNFQSVPAETENVVKKRRLHDAQEQLPIKTEDLDYVKLCKQTSTDSFQGKLLRALNDFDKFGE